MLAGVLCPHFGTINVVLQRTNKNVYNKNTRVDLMAEAHHVQIPSSAVTIKRTDN